MPFVSIVAADAVMHCGNRSLTATDCDHRPLLLLPIQMFFYAESSRISIFVAHNFDYVPRMRPNPGVVNSRAAAQVLNVDK